MKTLRNSVLALVLAFGGVAAAPVALAQATITEAIESGTVGERIDGYLGVVGDADAETIRMVQDINNRRRAAYEQKAAETGTTVEQVAIVTGEKLVARAQSTAGKVFMDESGVWQTAE